MKKISFTRRKIIKQDPRREKLKTQLVQQIKTCTQQVPLTKSVSRGEKSIYKFEDEKKVVN